MTAHRAGAGRLGAARLAGVLALILSLVALLGAGPAAAHDVATDLRAHAIVRVEPGAAPQARVALRLPLELMLNVDLPKRGNGYLDLLRLDDALPRALDATARALRIGAEGQPLTATARAARVALPADRAFEDLDRAWAAVHQERLPVATDIYWNQGWFDAAFTLPLPTADTRLTVDLDLPAGLRDRLVLDLRLVLPDGSTRAFTLRPGDKPVALDPRWHQAAATFTTSGLRHILGGADHLLFLLCLVLPFFLGGRPGAAAGGPAGPLAGNAWVLVGVVTAFTLAHTVTLVAAALGVVPSAPWFAPLVELGIVLSIVWMAVENVLGPDLRNRWRLAAGFGLVHGMGFSFGLAEELQFAGSHLLLSLLAFNIGIELGQLAVLLLAWPLLRWLGGHAPARQQIYIALVSAFVAHEAWHAAAERWGALQKAGGIEAIGWSGAGAALMLGAALVLGLRAWRQTGASRGAAQSSAAAQAARR